jgi:hypothetical protein
MLYASKRLSKEGRKEKQCLRAYLLNEGISEEKLSEQVFGSFSR